MLWKFGISLNRALKFSNIIYSLKKTEDFNMEHSQGDQSSNYKKNSLTLWGAVAGAVLTGGGVLGKVGGAAVGSVIGNQVGKD